VPDPVDEPKPRKRKQTASFASRRATSPSRRRTQTVSVWCGIKGNGARIFENSLCGEGLNRCFGIRYVKAKIIIGGLALTLLCKRPCSFPELPMFKDSPLSTQPMMGALPRYQGRNGTAAVQDAPPLVAQSCPTVKRLRKRGRRAYFFELKSVNWSVCQQVELENQRGLNLALARERLKHRKSVALTEPRLLLRSLLGPRLKPHRPMNLGSIDPNFIRI